MGTSVRRRTCAVITKGGCCFGWGGAERPATGPQCNVPYSMKMQMNRPKAVSERMASTPRKQAFKGMVCCHMQPRHPRGNQTACHQTALARLGRQQQGENKKKRRGGRAALPASELQGGVQRERGQMMQSLQPHTCCRPHHCHSCPYQTLWDQSQGYAQLPPVVHKPKWKTWQGLLCVAGLMHDSSRRQS